MPRVPERTNWLSLMDAEHEAVAYKTRRGKTLSSVEPVDVEVEVIDSLFGTRRDFYADILDDRLIPHGYLMRRRCRN